MSKNEFYLNQYFTLIIWPLFSWLDLKIITSIPVIMTPMNILLKHFIANNYSNTRDLPSNPSLYQHTHTHIKQKIFDMIPTPDMMMMENGENIHKMKSICGLFHHIHTHRQHAWFAFQFVCIFSDFADPMKWNHFSILVMCIYFPLHHIRTCMMTCVMCVFIVYVATYVSKYGWLKIKQGFCLFVLYFFVVQVYMLCLYHKSWFVLFFSTFPCAYLIFHPHFANINLCVFIYCIWNVVIWEFHEFYHHQHRVNICTKQILSQLKQIRMKFGLWSLKSTKILKFDNERW